MIFLIIDDERLAREELIDTIMKMDNSLKVYGFEKIYDGLIFIKSYHVDVVFLDIEMPEMNGLNVAKLIKDISPHTNIIFVTAYSQYAIDAFSLYVSGYLLKPVTKKMIREALCHLRHPIKLSGNKNIKIQTFGNFEIFVDMKPLYFSRSKSKEILAYLVHKKGSSCTLKELSAILFEDKQYTISLQKQMQTYISSMMKTLKTAGIEYIIIKHFNHFAVDVSKFDCDFYEFLKWNIDAVNSYTGEYMANYSWGEFTIGYLEEKLKKIPK